MVVSLVDKHDIITGERIQALCDITITCHQVNQFHSSLPLSVNRCFIETPDFKMLASAKSIFVYTHLLDVFVRFIFPLIPHPFVLVTHNSDDVVSDKWIPLLESNKIIHWFAMSCTFKHPKIESIPIGIANAQWSHGNIDLLYSIMISDIQQTHGLYANFSLYTNPLRRFDIASQLQDAGLTITIPENDQLKYLTEMKQHSYVACPVGNSPDTHRFWEALYLGCIPVVDIPDFYRNLRATHIGIAPDHWSKLGSVDSFPVWFGFDDVLKLSFWKSKIEHVLHSYA